MADIAIERTAVTLDDLMALGEDARVEVINGEVVEMAPVGGLHHLSMEISCACSTPT